MTIKKPIKNLILPICFIATVVNAQFQEDFLGHWNGTEELDSPSMTYENRNIAIVVEIGGDRDGFYIFTSSCDFLFNHDVDWAFHYIGFDKDSNQIIFLRRFITPLGVLGYEELIYDLVEWSMESFVAEHISDNGDTFHQIRMDIELLNIIGFLPVDVRLSKNYPNPFNPATNIDVYISAPYDGKLTIFDLSGRQIKILHQGRLQEGTSTFLWDGNDDRGRSVSGGVYIYRLSIDNEYVKSEKMTLLK